MTQTTEATIKNHIDGGTYTEVAYAGTRANWGILITRWVTYRNAVVFEVHRVSPDCKTFRLGKFNTEAEARTYANTMWRKDK